MPQVLKDSVREKILGNAMTEFTDMGYSSASMKSIAQKSGIAVGNIYRYFRNKEDLYNAIVSPVYNSINSLFEKPPGEYTIIGIEKRISKFIDIYRRNKQVFMMLLNNSDNTGFADMNNIIITNFSRAICRWSEHRTNNTNSEDDCAFIRAFSTAYLNGIISILSEPADEDTVSRRLFDFLNFMKEGIFRKFAVPE